jgi:hypothetical protein
LGQELLKDLAEDIARWWKTRKYLGSEAEAALTEFKQNLELGGYVFRADALLAPEEDVLDINLNSEVGPRLYPAD